MQHQQANQTSADKRPKLELLDWSGVKFYLQAHIGHFCIMNTAVLSTGGQDITSTTLTESNPHNPGLGDATFKYMVIRTAVNCVTTDENLKATKYYP